MTILKRVSLYHAVEIRKASSLELLHDISKNQHD